MKVYAHRTDIPVTELSSKHYIEVIETIEGGQFSLWKELDASDTLILQQAGHAHFILPCLIGYSLIGNLVATLKFNHENCLHEPFWEIMHVINQNGISMQKEAELLQFSREELIKLVH